MAKTHHQMIKEAVEALGEVKAREIMDYIKQENPKLDFKESSFRADIIGCSVNHPSSARALGILECPNFCILTLCGKPTK